MFTIGKSKEFFFDREVVIRAMNKAALQSLSKGGAFVMRSARKSIKPARVKASGRVAKGVLRGATRRTSTPGNPPYSHNGLLRDRIFFAADPNLAGPSVVIGPELIAKSTGAPSTLEFGGTTVVEIHHRVHRHSAPKVTRRTVRIDARPYMGPALVKEAPQLPAQFRNSMVRGI